MGDTPMTTPTWRTSSFSNNGTCLAVAEVNAGIAIRNSQHPERGMLTVSVDCARALVAASRAGEFDDLSRQ
jgi:hypothetical protein